MGIGEWHKEMHRVLKRGEFKLENIPALVKRCPVCNGLSLEFDAKTGRICCTKCGFEEHFPILK